ncbi:MAG: DUF222 domain-containing protein, partial [Planctomycetaceae bacterium]
MADYAAAFDPALLSGTAAEAIASDATAIINAVVTVRSLAMARATECSTWKRDGSKSPAHHLAKQTGTTVGEAQQALATAKKLEDQPEVAAAARSGELSPQQTAAIADAASADPEAAAKLLEAAKGSSLQELRDECARTKAAADPDPEATHRRIHDSRGARRFTTGDGGAEIRARGTVDAIAQIWSVICGFADAAFDQARIDGRHESSDAYAFDGLVAMAKAAAGNTTEEEPVPEGRRRRLPAPTKIIVRVDWPALMRGFCVDGETCEIAGLGPVPVSVVRQMIESGDPFLAGVVTDGTDIGNVVHLGRNPTALQMTALQWRDPTCSRMGCASAFTQTDHREDWADTHTTRYQFLDRLCAADHQLKTRHNRSLVDG